MSFKWADVADDNDEGMTPESDDTSQKTYTLADLQAAREEERERRDDQWMRAAVQIIGINNAEAIRRALGGAGEGKS